MTIARGMVVPAQTERMYHCVTRCVRRAYLCGEDANSGKSFEHRKAWVKDRLQYLAGIFAVDVCGYAVMSNHLHVVIRTRPDRVDGWTDEQLAERWLRLFPKRRDGNGNPKTPSKNEVRALIGAPKKLELLRERLGSLSWFMRCLNEFVARKANREDDCKGRFWEGRFKCQALLDEAAVLACMAYVDLNPIRAKAAKTPEESDFTSVQDRISGRQERKQRLRGSAQGKTLPASALAPSSDGWLVPIGDERPHDRAALSMSLDEYLELLDWTGRALRTGKRGQIPAHLRPILERLQLNHENWMETVQRFGGLFCHIAGKCEALAEAATAFGRKWLKGMRASRAVFALSQ